MRKIVVSFLVIMGVIVGVNAAPRQVGRGNVTQQASSDTGRGGTTRSAVAPSKNVAPRSATKVSARAATTTQKVINSGTKIAAATQNTVVSDECQNKYFGCMDAFCMLDNTSGGRCLCSDRNAELDTVLNEIENLDQRTYEMATLGVEQIEMGENADAAIAKANAVADSTVRSGKKGGRQSLDLSLWNTDTDFDDDEIFFETGTLQSTVDGKTGDALQNAASSLCTAQIPECSKDMSMLHLLYAQRIKSDCTAYENSLKQRKNASQTKLSAAQKALREAALEQLQTANKYDLGQCAVQFKKCMQTTGECGEDFANCATVAAFDNTNSGKSTSKKAKNYSIQGDVTTIEISASTYDTLVAKKPLCEHVTKSCVAVADKVWDTFLRDIAPTVKSAELIAEDDIRQSCIGNIAKCFRNACRDNIDPDDPEGSYDMCLTRPETMLSACKIPLNACGIDATNVASAEKSQIWNFVVARLAFMRVDSCTKAVKSCLQSTDRCGSDYSQCIGLDTDTILAMCPSEKLVACQENGEKKPLSEMTNLITGILLNMDNSLLQQCQNAVTSKMLEICGDTATCAAFDKDDTIGTDSLMSYKNTDGDYVIDGLVMFSNVKVNEVDESSTVDDVKFGKYQLDISDYINNLGVKDEAAQRVVASLQSIGARINKAVNELIQDPQIKMCVEGRDMSQIRGRVADESDRTVARYPNLTDSAVMTIIDSGLARANKNYAKKYNSLLAQAMESQDSEIKTAMCAAMASNTTSLCTKRSLSGVCREYENLFDGMGFDVSSDDGTYSTKFVVSGLTFSQLAEVQINSETETSYYVDGNGRMLGRIMKKGVYSPSTGLCTITTEIAMCRDSGWLSNIVYRMVDSLPEKACWELNDPTITTQTIEM